MQIWKEGNVFLKTFYTSITHTIWRVAVDITICIRIVLLPWKMAKQFLYASNHHHHAFICILPLNGTAIRCDELVRCTWYVLTLGVNCFCLFRSSPLVSTTFGERAYSLIRWYRIGVPLTYWWSNILNVVSSSLVHKSLFARMCALVSVRGRECSHFSFCLLHVQADTTHRTNQWQSSYRRYYEPNVQYWLYSRCQWKHQEWMDEKVCVCSREGRWLRYIYLRNLSIFSRRNLSVCRPFLFTQRCVNAERFSVGVVVCMRPEEVVVICTRWCTCANMLSLSSAFLHCVRIVWFFCNFISASLCWSLLVLTILLPTDFCVSSVAIAAASAAAAVTTLVVLSGVYSWIMLQWYIVYRITVYELFVHVFVCSCAGHVCSLSLCVFVCTKWCSDLFALIPRCCRKKSGFFVCKDE